MGYGAGGLLVKATGRWRPLSPLGSVDVEVGLPVGSRVMGTAAGAFRSAGALGDPGEERLEVRARTGCGDITIRRADPTAGTKSSARET